MTTPAEHAATVREQSDVTKWTRASAALDALQAQAEGFATQAEVDHWRELLEAAEAERDQLAVELGKTSATLAYLRADCDRLAARVEELEAALAQRQPE